MAYRGRKGTVRPCKTGATSMFYSVVFLKREQSKQTRAKQINETNKGKNKQIVLVLVCSVSRQR